MINTISQHDWNNMQNIQPSSVDFWQVLIDTDSEEIRLNNK